MVDMQHNTDPQAGLDEPLLRQLFESAVRQSGALGAQLSIIKAGYRVNFAAGFSHARRGVAMTPDTLMQIGSVTKVLNATMVLTLVEEGLLDLDTPILEYAPEFQVADPEATRALTLRHLMSMSSGLDNGPYDGFGGEDEAVNRYVAALEFLPQHFAPGKHFGYSNAGICIAGYVASRVSGKPWETLLRERLLTPASLEHFAALEGDVLYQTVSAGHELLANGSLEVIDPTFTMARACGPSGISLALSASDLARFGLILINRGLADTGARILSNSSVTQMETPQIDVPTRKYGTAWCVGPFTDYWNGVQVFGHGGTTQTSSSFLHWIPDQQGVIAFIVNTHAAMAAFSSTVFDEITKAAFGIAKPRFDVREEPLTEFDPSRYIGVYQELGATMLVTEGDGKSLGARYIPNVKSRGRWPYGAERSFTLAPLGSERFLVNPPGGPENQRGVVDTSFFGEDQFGRATNMLNLVFPMRRID
jgi:CubicO group peptidase (beta-lactamase class C family)